MSSKMKWLVAALVVSVGLNLFVAGVWIGRELSGGPERRAGAPARMDFNIRRLASYLPEAEQRQLRRLMKDHRRSMKATFKGMRVSEKRIRTLMLAETVDREALKAALDEHEQVARQLQGPVKSIILDVVAKLDRETRQKIADEMFSRRNRLRRGHPGPGRGPRNGHENGPGPNRGERLPPDPNGG